MDATNFGTPSTQAGITCLRNRDSERQTRQLGHQSAVTKVLKIQLMI